MASKHNTENSLLPYAVIKAATVGNECDNICSTKSYFYYSTISYYCQMGKRLQKRKQIRNIFKHPKSRSMSLRLLRSQVNVILIPFPCTPALLRQYR